MRLPLLFAWRYIFSKKSTQAIHIISGISVLGMSVGSMALVVLMSVFNGFEDILRDLISAFKPDIQVTAHTGKTFSLDSSRYAQIKNIEGVLSVSRTLEEVALFQYDGVQNLARIKGVDRQFEEVIDLDTMLQTGRYQTFDEASGIYYAIVGAGLEASMSISPHRTDGEPLTVFMPKREAKKLAGNSKPFRQRALQPTAIYSVQQAEYDNFVITDLKFVQDLLAYENDEVSALEIKLNPQIAPELVKNQLQTLLGADFLVKNRYEQDEAFFKITNLEKKVGYVIFSFTLVLVAFNMIGALWMLVLEKQKDISVLKALGANNTLIARIFLLEGTLLSFIGAAIGLFLGFGLCILQQKYGLVRLDNGGGSFIIDAYPVAMRAGDFVVVVLTVLVIGSLAALLPAIRATRVEGIIRND